MIDLFITGLVDGELLLYLVKSQWAKERKLPSFFGLSFLLLLELFLNYGGKFVDVMVRIQCLEVYKAMYFSMQSLEILVCGLFLRLNNSTLQHEMAKLFCVVCHE